MTKQPEALRLADALLRSWPQDPPCWEASTELRRQHELIVEMRAAMALLLLEIEDDPRVMHQAKQMVSAALAKAEAQS